MFPEVTLVTPTREDVQRLSDWLSDPEVNAVWFGVGDNGKPLHATYEPAAILAGGASEWDQIFNDESRSIFSIYNGDGEHIGEGQLLVEWPLLEARRRRNNAQQPRRLSAPQAVVHGRLPLGMPPFNQIISIKSFSRNPHAHLIASKNYRSILRETLTSAWPPDHRTREFVSRKGIVNCFRLQPLI